MQEQMQQRTDQYYQQPQNNASTQNAANGSKGDYIDFEEVKD